MVPREKLGCSELKRLQLKRRKDKSMDDGSAVNPKQKLTFKISSNSDFLESDESELMNNPFSKNVLSSLESKVESASIANDSDKGLYDADYLKNQDGFLKSSDSNKKTPFKPEINLLEKSLKTVLTIESDKSFSNLKEELLDPLYLLRTFKNPDNDNIMVYYRYPDASLPANQKKAIHKALLQSSKKDSLHDENLIWYRMFSEKWRKALLSVFDMLKHSFIDTFYFVQDNLTVLFEKNKKDFSLKAYLQLSSLALAEDLKNNGIEYRFMHKKELADLGNDNCASSNEDTNPSDDENEDLESELNISQIRMKKSKTIFTKETIVIEGTIALAEFIDFLINLKDRHSYAILPEIYSPGPFLHGTLRSNTLAFSGPFKGNGKETFYHMKIKGIIFPNSIGCLLQELEASDHMISINFESEGNTDFLSAFKNET